MIGWLFNIFIFLGILAIGKDVSYVETPRGRKTFIVLSTLQLLSIQLLKDNSLLPDAATYKYYYEHFSWDLFGSFEVGFRYFVKILTSISPDFYLFVVVYGIIQVFTHVWAINKYSTNLLLTYVLFITTSFFALFVVRQYIAIALCIWSIPFILNKKIIPFIILTVVAISFHGSAGVWVITYFIYWIDLKKPIIPMSLIFVGLFLIYKGVDSFFPYLENVEKLQYYLSDIEEQYTWKTLAVSASVVAFSSFCYGKNIKNLSGSRKLFYLMSWLVVD